MTDDDLRELAERAHLLDELTKQPGWEIFLQSAAEELEKTKRSIFAGRLDHEQYVRATGYLNGGEMVAAIPESMMELYVQALSRKREEEADAVERAYADDPAGLPV